MLRAAAPGSSPDTVDVDTVEVPPTQNQERLVELPEIQVMEVEKMITFPHVQEVVREVSVPQVQVVDVEKIIHTREKGVEVPQVQVQERARHVPVVTFQVPLTEVQTVERTAEVPQVRYEHKPVEVPKKKKRRKNKQAAKAGDEKVEATEDAGRKAADFDEPGKEGRDDPEGKANTMNKEAGEQTDWRAKALRMLAVVELTEEERDAAIAENQVLREELGRLRDRIDELTPSEEADEEAERSSGSHGIVSILPWDDVQRYSYSDDAEEMEREVEELRRRDAVRCNACAGRLDDQWSFGEGGRAGRELWCGPCAGTAFP